MKFTTLLMTLVASSLAVPTPSKSQQEPPVGPPPPNTKWEESPCIPASTNPNYECSLIANHWSGQWLYGWECGENAVVIWCANYLNYSVGYYPTQNQQNVLDTGGVWSYKGCTEGSISPFSACGNNHYPFMYDRAPDGTYSCSSSTAYQLWCANATYYLD